MDLTCRLGCLCALGNCPSANLLGSCGEVGDKTEKRVACLDKLIKTALCNSHILKEHLLFLALKLCDLGLYACANGDYRAVLTCGKLLNCHISRITRRLLCRLVLTYVCDVNNGLACQERSIKEASLLVLCKSHGARALTLLKNCVNALKKLQLTRKSLVALHSLLGSVYSSLYHFHIREDKLHIDGLKISHGVDRSVNVDNIIVLEAAYDVNYRIALTDVRQELVAKSLTLRSSLYKTCNINELNNSRSVLLGVIHFSKHVKAAVRHGYNAYVRLYRAEGIVCRFRAGVCQSIKKC